MGSWPSTVAVSSLEGGAGDRSEGAWPEAALCRARVTAAWRAPVQTGCAEGALVGGGGSPEGPGKAGPGR